MPDFDSGLIPPFFGKPKSEVLIVGPVKGFSPQIGILVSMLAFTRMEVLECVSGMSVRDLDFLLDANANTVGAMLLHLAAVETCYQLNTFEGIGWDSFPDRIKKQWQVPLNLGEPARKTIKGNSIDYYLGVLDSVREKTLAGFLRRDDDWLAMTETITVEGKHKGWSVNNYAKWFHVAEHESNHNGQFKLIKGRLPQESVARGA